MFHVNLTISRAGVARVDAEVARPLDGVLRARQSYRSYLAVEQHRSVPGVIVLDPCWVASCSIVCPLCGFLPATVYRTSVVVLHGIVCEAVSRSPW